MIPAKNKRILLITETPPGTPNGFGVTLDALFGNLDPKVLFTDKDFQKDVLGKNYLLAQVPFHRSKKYGISFLMGKIPEWRNRYSRKWVRTHLDSSYEIVYSFVYSGTCLKYGAWLAELFGAKHFVHIADHQDEFLSNDHLIKIITSSYSKAAIGNNMKEFYQAKFEQDFEVFHNPVASHNLPFDSLRDSAFSSTRKLRVLFLGSLFKTLHAGSMDDICDAITIVGRSGIPIELHMYGQLQPASFLKERIDGKFVKHLGTIDSENRFKLMRDYDAYVVPATFDPYLAEKYSYSIPTKLTEVLATGRPMLFYGPKCMEAYRFCKQMNAGYLITDRSIDNVCSFFKDLILNFSDYEVKANLSSNRITEEYSLEKTRDRFAHFINN